MDILCHWGTCNSSTIRNYSIVWQQFCIIRCSTVPVPPRAVVAAAVVAAAAVETEGAADPGEGQDPQDLEQDGRFGFTRYLGVELTPIGGLCH
jgi:hypothetical protein